MLYLYLNFECRKLLFRRLFSFSAFSCHFTSSYARRRRRRLCRRLRRLRRHDDTFDLKQKYKSSAVRQFGISMLCKRCSVWIVSDTLVHSHCTTSPTTTTMKFIWPLFIFIFILFRCILSRQNNEEKRNTEKRPHRSGQDGTDENRWWTKQSSTKTLKKQKRKTKCEQIN